MWQSVYYRHFEDDIESAFINDKEVLPYAITYNDTTEMKELIHRLKDDGFTCVGSDNGTSTLLVNLEFRRWCRKPDNDYLHTACGKTFTINEFLNDVYSPWLSEQ